MSDGVRFKNGKLKILQISDAQDFHWVRKAMVKMLEMSCDKLKPDLVVFTGDNILGNHLSDRRFGKGKKQLTRQEEYQTLKTALNHVLSIPEKRGIPFAVIFGNHDDRNSFTKDEQADIICAYRMNRGFHQRGKLCGTYRLPLYSADGEREKGCLWMIDTARYDHSTDTCYWEITKEVVEWYKNERHKQAAANQGESLPSLMFMHIPLSLTRDFAVPCSHSESTATHDGEHYKLRDDAKGVMYEYPETVTTENGFYQEVQRDSGVCAIIAGHDHVNSFEAIRDGIRFIATPGASFRSYGNHLRGVRVFEIDEDDFKNFKTYTVDYDRLCGRSLKARLRYFMDADDKEREKAALLSAAALAAVAAVAGVAKRLLK